MQFYVLFIRFQCDSTFIAVLFYSHIQWESLPNSGNVDVEFEWVTRSTKVQESLLNCFLTSKLGQTACLCNKWIHDTAIRKRRGKKWHPWESSKRKPLLTLENTMARLTCAKKHLDDFGETILWTDKTKAELLGSFESVTSA